MSTYGSRNRAGVLPHLPLPTKEARPVRDKAYQKKTQQAILDYLQDAQFQLPGLSIKTLQAPSVKEFQAIFKFLVHEIDPESEYKFLQHGKKFEDEFIAILKDLRYPHADQISKTALQAVNSPHSWPAILAALHWMVELSEVGRIRLS
jgi:kinetochore protein NDC80